MAKTSYGENSVKFRFLVHQNLGIDLTILFLSSSLTNIGYSEHSYFGHIEKWLPHPPEDKFGWGPGLNLLVMGSSNSVPNFMLVSKSA